MRHIHKIREEVLAIIMFIGVIWLVFLLDSVLPLEKFGLIPRESNGLIGIIAMTFLHADLQHIMSNTVPLIVLLALLAGSQADSKKIVLLIIVLGGFLLWIFGRSHSIHIGASLLVFGLATFLVVSGLLEKRTIPLMVSLIVAIMYGSTLISGVLPFKSGVSWEGHLMGGIAGVVTAWLLVELR
jgi:membrane associated rhomboid family serine protease